MSDTTEEPSGSVRVTVDPTTAEGYPLVRTKFDGFNSGIVSVERYERDRDLLGALDLGTLRFDGGLGGSFLDWTEPFVTGESGDPTYEFAEIDRLIDLLEGIDVRPYWSYSYVPPALQPDDDHRDPPVDLDAWGEVFARFARHFRERADAGSCVAYHEVYNEPDLDEVFFTGDARDYFDMFEAGARALAEADPDTPIGGPSAAGPGGEDWDEAFLEFVSGRDLPLDFFSFHWYGSDYGDRLREVAARLDASDEFDHVEMHLNEFNSYRIQPLTADDDALTHRYPAAALLLSNLARFLSTPALTKVHWAQIQDAGEPHERLGLISLDGVRKPAYHAWRIYSRLPVRQRAIETTGDGATQVASLAGSDDDRVGVALWNEETGAVPLAVNLADAPFPTGDLAVYRIDATHSAPYDGATTDELEAVERREGVDIDNWSWSGNLPGEAVVYVEIDRPGVDPDPHPTVDVADLVRVHHHYPDRTSDAYAEFDPESWRAWLGLMGETGADQVVGATVENLPAALDVANDLVGVEGTDAHVGLRVDFEVDGNFESSVCYSLSGAGDESIPWGTTAAPDEVVLAGGDVRLPVAEHAPEGWTGRASLAFRLRDAGPDARWRATVRPG